MCAQQYAYELVYVSACSWAHIFIYVCIYVCWIYVCVYICVYMYVCIYVLAIYMYIHGKLDLVCGILIQKTNAIIFHITCSSLIMLFFVLFITCCIKCFQFCVLIFFIIL